MRSVKGDIKTFRSDVLGEVGEILKKNELFSNAGYSAKTTLLFSSKTTRIWALTYTIGKKRYADLYVICFPGKEYYMSITQFYNEYFSTVVKRFGRAVDTLKNRGLKITGSQIVFVGNFKSGLISDLKEVNELHGVKTSVRALPVGKKRKFHRIRGFVVKTKDDVVKTLIYWIGSWFRERVFALGKFLRSRREKKEGNKLMKIIENVTARIFVSLQRMDPEFLRLIENPG
ncbi:hypothetical protein DRO54_07030 [Candidatus Bathyarchaeota archaeon]|nr:MAG: hypothetical protein DRO54_07030 [Candidatus Bathyarchaeota archaeon]